jgi:archaellum component FlaG (FlaF/FlaG flagellin family)
MAVSAQRVSVTSTPVALNTASTAGLVLLVKNVGAAAVDLGASSVASGAGFDLAASATVEVSLDPGDVLYAVTGTTSTVAVLRT